MKTVSILCLLSFLNLGVLFSQEQKAKSTVYNPNADAALELSNAIKKARAENKHIMVMVGGNWCKWCLRYNELCKTDKQIDSMLSASYIFIHINYSKENKNLEVLKKLEFPQRFGFPVLVILDNEGRRIHTQDSGFLESGESYDKSKIMTFLKTWTVQALDPVYYKE